MYISEAMLISALGYEKGKQLSLERSQALWDIFKGRLVAFMDEYDRKHYQGVECTGDILCERSGRRHRDGCIGRTEPFSVYAEGLRSIQ